MPKKHVTTKQTFHEHVKELRIRIGWSALAFLIGGTVGYIYRIQAINFLKAPSHTPLYYNTPAGGFNLVMEVAAICGLMIAIPMLAYQLVSFVAPAWKDTIGRRHVFMITILSAVLATAGAAFAYYIMLPLSLHFFQSFSISGVHPLISANSYLDFVVKCIITFILIFQLPLIILFINRIKPMSPRKMLKWEKYVIVGSLLLAVILPFTYDPLSQFVLAVPIIFLYNLSLFLVWTTNNHKSRKLSKRAMASIKEQMTPQPRPLPRPQPVAQPALASKVLPVAFSAHTRLATTTRRPIDITLPRSHARPQHLTLNDMLPKPNADALDLPPAAQ
jgi:sec-independent protein translocase protein TatC